MNLRTGFGVIGICLTALLIQGCASAYRSVPSTLPHFAQVVTPGVVIEAADGSWRLESGEPTQFTPPVFVTTDWDNRAKSSNLSLATGNFTKARYDSSARLRRGAISVRVTIPSRVEPLYGKIIFLDVRETGEASARRMWTIAVPQRYVAVAESGNIATVFQPYRSSTSANDLVSWVMWISSLPIE